jgi:hypothetical protein
MVDYKDLNYDDVYLYNNKPCKFSGLHSYQTDKSGRKYNVEFNILYHGEKASRTVYDLGKLKYVYDRRIRLRDLVDVRRENGIVLRGTVVEIKPDEELPYAVSGNGALVWMAAHEFERFVRADAPERAYETLTAVRARIDALETELTALKLTEEVLEGVYGV